MPNQSVSQMQEPTSSASNTATMAMYGAETNSTANGALPAEKSSLYLPQLDGLRALAFLLVFSSHASVISPNDLPLPGFCRALTLPYQELAWFGWTGLDLFLVLSAFLITSILVREEQRFGTINAKLFLFRRMLRIWPVYFFAITTGLFLFPILNFPAGARMGSPAYWHAVLTCAPWLYGFALNIGIATLVMNPPANLNPLWSISLEEQFYVFWAFFFKSVRCIKKRYFALGAMLLFTICMRAHLNSILPGHIPYFQNTLSRLDPLIFGATAAFMLALNPKIRNFVNRFGWLVLSAAILVLEGVKTLTPTPFVKECFNPFSLTMLDLGWALFVVALTSVPSLIRIFSSRLIVNFGRLTYGMYVFHAPVLECIIRYILHPLKLETDGIWRPLIKLGTRSAGYVSGRMDRLERLRKENVSAQVQIFSSSKRAQKLRRHPLWSLLWCLQHLSTSANELNKQSCFLNCDCFGYYTSECQRCLFHAI